MLELTGRPTIKIHQLLDRQETALKENDTSKALRLLKEMRDELEKQNAWQWLRTNEPEDYDQLTSKLAQARKVRDQSGKVKLRQLIEVFEWCEAYGIPVEYLRTPDNLHKYWDVSPLMNDIINNDDLSEETKYTRLIDVIERVQAHATRRETRQWAWSDTDGQDQNP